MWEQRSSERFHAFTSPRLIPFAKFWCITKGYPVIPGNFISEQITLKKIDVDELADYKEPIIVNKRSFTNRFRKDHEHGLHCWGSGDASLGDEPGICCLSGGDQHKPDEVQFCPMLCSFKDLFHSGRYAICKARPPRAGTADHTGTHQSSLTIIMSPLSFPLRKRLLIPQNSAVPLMIHLKSIKIPKYGPKRSDLEITTRKLPEHFDWSLYRLFLGNSREEHRETNFKK